MCEICNTPDSRPSDGYNEFEQTIIDKFNNSITDNEHLFTTGAEGLWEAYINNLPEGQQHYACTACRHFIERYGGLVTISDNGKMKSALWQTSGIPSFFVVSAQAMHRIVLKSKVTGVFFSKNQTLGQPVTGEWTHLSVTLPPSMVYTERVKSVGEITAEKKADFQILITGLKEYPLEAVEQAVTLLKTDSLERRFARIEELQTIWKPVEEVKTDGEGTGVFSHLKPKDKTGIQKMKLPVKTITWVKFFETVLPTANSIEYYVQGRDNFSAILTAQNIDAPPIIQWDTEEKRNPFSWYVKSNLPFCSDWNVSSGYNKVTGICYQPNMWQDGFDHHGISVIFLIQNAKEIQKQSGNGNALFPEILKSELREVRSTIEAYSNSAEIFGFEEASACGIRLQCGIPWNAKVKVVSDMGEAEYILDRWD